MKAALVGILFFVLALSLRVMNAPLAIVNGIPQLSPVDELYHLKRIAYSAAEFPRVLERDPERGPRGNPLWCPWPPLYDLAAGGAVRLLGGSTTGQTLARVVWFPPLLFALFVGLAAFVVARARGLTAGALLGIALAASPFLVRFSSIGSIDHHFLEPPLTFAIVWGVVRVIRRGGMADGVLLGVAMIAAMFVQTALLVTCALAFVVLFFFAERKVTAAIGFAMLAAAVALYASTRPDGYPSNEWFLGWPHAALFAAAAFALALRARNAPAWLALAAGGALALAVPSAVDAVIGGSHFFGGDPWLRTIKEFLPVIGEPWPDLISDVALLSGGLLLVWPFAWRAWRRRDRAELAIAIFAVAYLALDLSSRRFRPLAIAFLALAGALYAADLLARGRRRSAIAAMLLVAVTPIVQLLLWGRDSDSPRASYAPWLRAASFLQRQSPGGRVLAPWSMGHCLDVIGGRPVIVDNFGSMPSRIAFDRAHDAFLTTHESTLARYCDDAGVRWIVFTNPLEATATAASVTGRDPEAYVRIGANGAATHATRLAQATCSWRAYYDRGAARPERGMFGTPLRAFRLVYVDSDPSWRGNAALHKPALEIWERIR